MRAEPPFSGSDLPVHAELPFLNAEPVGNLGATPAEQDGQPILGQPLALSDGPAVQESPSQLS